MQGILCFFLEVKEFCSIFFFLFLCHLPSIVSSYGSSGFCFRGMHDILFGGKLWEDILWGCTLECYTLGNTLQIISDLYPRSIHQILSGGVLRENTVGSHSVDKPFGMLWGCKSWGILRECVQGLCSLEVYSLCMLWRYFLGLYTLGYALRE